MNARLDKRWTSQSTCGRYSARNLGSSASHFCLVAVISDRIWEQPTSLLKIRYILVPRFWPSAQPHPPCHQQSEFSIVLAWLAWQSMSAIAQRSVLETDCLTASFDVEKPEAWRYLAFAPA
jgi:hypothetical protein